MLKKQPTKLKIKSPAIKTAKGVVSGKPDHAAVAKKAVKSVGTSKGPRGFITSNDGFVGRQEAKKIAKSSGQASVRGKRGLHSRDI